MKTWSVINLTGLGFLYLGVYMTWGPWATLAVFGALLSKMARDIMRAS